MALVGLCLKLADILKLSEDTLDVTHTRFAIPIGEALSEVGGAIVDVLIADSLAWVERR